MRGLSAWRQFRPGLALLAFIIILAVLLAGQTLARNLRVDRPLAREIKALPGVARYEIEEGRDGLVLRLTMNRVPNLEDAAAKILAAVEKRHDLPVTSVEIADRRGDLASAYYELRFSLEEARTTGRYSILGAALADLAARHGLDCARVYPGSRFLFVQLEKGRAFLYEALPRADATQPAPQGGGI